MHHKFFRLSKSFVSLSFSYPFQTVNDLQKKNVNSYGILLDKKMR